MGSIVTLVLALWTLTLHTRFTLCGLPEQNDTYQDYKDTSHCDKNSLSIRVTTSNSLSTLISNESQNSIPYGNLMFVMCVGEHVEDLVMSKNGETLKTKHLPVIHGLETFGIKWQDKPDLQISRFECTDLKTACQRSVVVSVTPAVVVSATNLLESGHEYTVQYDGDMSVSCFGPNATGLVITKDGKALRTDQKDNNTIVWTTKADLQRSEYVCTDLNTTVNGSVLVIVGPKISIRLLSNGTETKAAEVFKLEYEVTFGEAIELTCSGPRPVKLINLDDSAEMTQNITGTTVKSLVEIYKDTAFACIISEHPEQNGTARVLVRPLLEVSSPSIQKGKHSHWYGIKKGDPLQIACSGPDVSQLAIFNNDGHKEPSTIMSNATIMLSIKKGLINGYSGEYLCSMGGMKSYSYVRVAALPEAIDFRCISRNVESINCSWTASNPEAKYTLYHVENQPTRVCTKVQQSKSTSIRYSEAIGNMLIVNSAFKHCIWYNTDSPGYPDQVKTLHFLMKSCNDFGCSIQHFFIDHLSIVKPEPPQGLKVIGTSSSKAMLQWGWTILRAAGEDLLSGFGAFLFKVEYVRLGAEPVEANSSLVSCMDMLHCSIELTLPCPGQSYTVRIYQRLEDTIGEEFWSEPSTVSFYTNAENTQDDMCNSEPMKTAEVMTYFNQKLKHEVHLEIQKVKEEVDLLKKKLALIRTYIDQH